MKKVNELIPPYNDAVNYKTRVKNEFFKKMFNCTAHYDKVSQPDCFFILGEKGSGKTALALYYEKESNKKEINKLISINTTLYKQFILLKKKGNLEYTDYESIWRTMLLTELAKIIRENQFFKNRKLENAIKFYNENGLLTQLNTNIEDSYAEGLSDGVKLSKTPFDFTVNANYQHSVKESSTEIKHHIIQCESNFKQALSNKKLKQKIIIFFDGIDACPQDVSKKEYYECIQGLTNAIYSLDIYFASKYKTADTVRYCLLIRPDIFSSLNLYNTNGRIIDNSIVLNWCTSQKDYKSSALYKTINKYFSSQNFNEVKGWDDYFQNSRAFFIYLINNSFQRPRDYFSAIRILIDYCQNNGIEENYFPEKAWKSNYFKNEFGKYMLGEIEDYASYYMCRNDFTEYMKFFQFLNGKKTFSWNEYCEAFYKFQDYMDQVLVEKRDYYYNEQTFLQFLYEINCIGYCQKTKSNKTLYKWAYRERSNSDLSPRVKENVNYIVFPGIMNVLDIGESYISSI